MPFIFIFISVILGGLAVINGKEFLPVFSSKNFIVSGLTFGL
jgi:hypothetical protein